MLQPVRTKYRKAHKGRIHGTATRASKINYGSFALKAMAPERIIGKQTNNTAELSAVIEVFSILKDEIQSNQKIIIYSDSMYTIRWCGEYGRKCERNGFKSQKTIPNLELGKELYLLCKENPNVKFNLLPSIFALYPTPTNSNSLVNPSVTPITILLIKLLKVPAADLANFELDVGLTVKDSLSKSTLTALISVNSISPFAPLMKSTLSSLTETSTESG